MRRFDRDGTNGDDQDVSAYFALLRQSSEGLAEDPVDWDAFHARLVARAGGRLARLRRARETTWWEVTARWSRTALPVAIAAGIALVVLIRSSPRDGGPRDTGGVSLLAAADTGRVGSARAAFESAVVGGSQTRGDDAMFLPTAAEMLIPSLGERGR